MKQVNSDSLFTYLVLGRTVNMIRPKLPRLDIPPTKIIPYRFFLLNIIDDLSFTRFTRFTRSRHGFLVPFTIID